MHLYTSCIQSALFSKGFNYRITMVAFLENLVLTYRRQINVMNEA